MKRVGFCSGRVTTCISLMASALQLAAAASAPGHFETDVFTNVPIAGLPGVHFSSVAWGDYDNDGRLDFLLTGSTDNDHWTTQIWRNTGEGFVEVTATIAPGLPGVTIGSVGWADYDNDGWLDFLLTGSTNNPVRGICQLWHNTGGAFTHVPIAGLPGVFASAIAWGDFDNDGRPDFLVTGQGATFQPVSQLWRNTGNTFTNVPIAGLPGVYDGSVAWGDYDGDGRLDFLLTGSDNATRYTQLWRNTGGTFTHVPIPGLPPVSISSVAWGDYDSDGRLDFLLTGQGPGFESSSQLWRNTGTTFTNVPVAGLRQVSFSSVGWADFDNDGRLDFLLTGAPETSQLWRNTGPTFTNVPIAGLPQISIGAVGWADADNDGRLDFLLAGSPDGGATRVSQLWRSRVPETNTPPGAPVGLAMTRSARGALLSWNEATDAQTPSRGLTYNVRAGTTPGGTNLLAAHVDPGSGWRRVPGAGNAQLRRFLPVAGLTDGQPVYWSVQAVDTAFAGGPFATEMSVPSLPTLSIVHGEGTEAIVSWAPPTFGWVLQERTGGLDGEWSHSPSGELNPAIISTAGEGTLFRLVSP